VTLETSYGTVVSSWRLDGQRFVLNVTVPPNTAAEVQLWDTTVDHVRTTAGMRDARQAGEDVIVTVGSGSYEFTVAK